MGPGDGAGGEPDVGTFKQVKPPRPPAPQESCADAPPPAASSSMSQTIDTGFAPDPEDAADVLAFVLCPAQAFAPAGDAEELEAVGELMLPIKAEAIRRWSVAAAARKRS
jgi:hypothetical protein